MAFEPYHAFATTAMSFLTPLLQKRNEHTKDRASCHNLAEDGKGSGAARADKLILDVPHHHQLSQTRLLMAAAILQSPSKDSAVGILLPSCKDCYHSDHNCKQTRGSRCLFGRKGAGGKCETRTLGLRLGGVPLCQGRSTSQYPIDRTDDDQTRDVIQNIASVGKPFAFFFFV